MPGLFQGGSRGIKRSLFLLAGLFLFLRRFFFSGRFFHGLAQHGGLGLMDGNFSGAVRPVANPFFRSRQSGIKSVVSFEGILETPLCLT